MPKPQPVPFSLHGLSFSTWDEAYKGTPPWETNRVDPQLKAYLAAKLAPGRRMLELGCGTGTNAVFLAQRGFLVTGVDLSPKAIALAKARAKEAAAIVDFHAADATKLRLKKQFDWAFDRGCYHSLPTKVTCAKYRAALLRHLEPRGHLFLLVFADKEPPGQGPRRLSKADIITEFSRDFTIRSIADFRFETSLPGFSPHGYAALLAKK